MLLNAYRTDVALELLEAAPPSAGSTAATPGRGRAQVAAARAPYVLPAIRVGRSRVSDEVLEAAEHANLVPIIADALITRGTSLANVGRLYEGSGVIEAGRQLAEAHGLTATICARAQQPGRPSWRDRPAPGAPGRSVAHRPRPPHRQCRPSDQRDRQRGGGRAPDGGLGLGAGRSGVAAGRRDGPDRRRVPDRRLDRGRREPGHRCAGTDGGRRHMDRLDDRSPDRRRTRDGPRLDRDGGGAVRGGLRAVLATMSASRGPAFASFAALAGRAALWAGDRHKVRAALAGSRTVAPTVRRSRSSDR